MAKQENHRSGTEQEIGNGGELHQLAGETHPPLTTQTGTIIADA
jgi:catalase